MYKKIFENGTIGKLELKNRLIVPPMLTEFANEDGTLSERYIRYYEEKAKGGWGLIICEDNVVEPRGAGFKCIPGLWSDDMMDKHRELVKRVHATDTKIAVQLYHAGRQSHSSLIGELPVAPSAIQDPVIGQTPRELRTEEVEELVQTFTNAAVRCKNAGYDAVEIHGAHGYLINQFLSPFSNKRTDKYGGTFRNRLRFPIEIITSIKEAVGEDYPVIYRISAQELVEGGLTIQDTKSIAIELEDAGVDAIHASGGVYKSSNILCAPTAADTAVFSDYAKEIKKVVEIPVITVNKIIYPEVAETLLREGKADFISMGRASIADPNLPNKAKEGREDEILHCIGCRQGCWNKLLLNEPISCLVNPFTGKEGTLDLSPVNTVKKIMVIGGGPAGMEAAIVAAKRGHDVTLFEKEAKVGGQWLLAAIPPGKEVLNTLTVWQKGEMKRQGVKVEYNKNVDESLIDSFAPDHIVLATGATPIKPNIAGVDQAHVFTSTDVLTGKVDLSGPIVVIGGGLVGSETAEHIAVHNQSVSIVEMMSEIAVDMEGGSKSVMMDSLNHYNVPIYTNSKVVEINENEVIVETDNVRKNITANQVVLAIGSVPHIPFDESILGKYNVELIGDAKTVGKALEGIQDAFNVAVDL